MEYTKGEWERDGNSIQVFQRGCICIAPKPQDGGVLERMDNLSLIAAAPDLYEACKAQHDAIDRLFARLIEIDNNFFPSKSGKPWEATIQGNKAIAKVKSNG